MDELDELSFKQLSDKIAIEIGAAFASDENKNTLLDILYRTQKLACQNKVCPECMSRMSFMWNIIQDDERTQSSQP